MCIWNMHADTDNSRGLEVASSQGGSAAHRLLHRRLHRELLHRPTPVALIVELVHFRGEMVKLTALVEQLLEPIKCAGNQFSRCVLCS